MSPVVGRRNGTASRRRRRYGNRHCDRDDEPHRRPLAGTPVRSSIRRRRCRHASGQPALCLREDASHDRQRATRAAACDPSCRPSTICPVAVGEIDGRDVGPTRSRARVELRSCTTIPCDAGVLLPPDGARRAPSLAFDVTRIGRTVLRSESTAAGCAVESWSGDGHRDGHGRRLQLIDLTEHVNRADPVADRDTAPRVDVRDAGAVSVMKNSVVRSGDRHVVDVERDARAAAQPRRRCRASCRRRPPTGDGSRQRSKSTPARSAPTCRCTRRQTLRRQATATRRSEGSLESSSEVVGERAVRLRRRIVGRAQHDRLSCRERVDRRRGSRHPHIQVPVQRGSCSRTYAATRSDAGFPAPPS